MAKIKFSVKDALPPKKDGAKSMWNKPSEAARLVQLRLAASESMKGSPPFRKNVRLSLDIFLKDPESETAGDLDNYITGVCDGLMSAHPRAKLDTIWNTPELAHIHPRKTIALEDDSAVISIYADKIPAHRSGPKYRVTLEGKITKK